MKPATLWHFVMEKTGSGESWVWRRTGPDGLVEAVSSGHHGNYGDIVYDAIRHGFHPRQQPWIVTDGGFTSHYFPEGKPASTLAPAPPAAPESKRT
jgi:hypothetical protein